MKTKNKDKTELKIYAFIIGITLLPCLILIVSSVGLYTTGNLWFLLIEEIMETFFRLLKFMTIISFILVVVLKLIMYLPRNERIRLLNFIDWDKIDSIDFKKAFIILFLLSIIIMDGMTKNRNIYINSTVPSYLSYKINIVKDALFSKTKTVNTNNIDILTVTKTGRKGRTYRYYYAKFVDDNGLVFSSSIESYDTNIIYYLLENEEKIKIEYYENTGIIKSFDGIDTTDYTNLKKRVEETRQNKKEKEEIKKKEDDEETRKQREINNKRYELLKGSIDKNFDVLKEELKEYNEFEYDVKYISTKLHPYGAVAFIDYAHSKDEVTTIYVVNSDVEEEMIPMPNLKAGMKKEEAIKMLENAGFKVSVSEFDAVNGEIPGTLKYYQYSPGTLLPKGLEVNFSVNK